MLGVHYHWAERILGVLPHMLGLPIIYPAFSLHLGLWFWLFGSKVFLWPDLIKVNDAAPVSLHLGALPLTLPTSLTKSPDGARF